MEHVIVTKYQDANQADSILKIQKELDEYVPAFLFSIQPLPYLAQSTSTQDEDG